MDSRRQKPKDAHIDGTCFRYSTDCDEIIGATQLVAKIDFLLG